MIYLRITALALALLASPVTADNITGRAKVVDGDTLFVAQVKIRLNGIDAPEWDTRAGRVATNTLKEIVRGRIVRCIPNGDRSYDRIIARCWVGETDIAAAVIASGAALDCARYSGGRYREYETREARRTLRRAGYC